MNDQTSCIPPIIVYCGNGGDYEYVRDAHYWTHWIIDNICNSKSFYIKPAPAGDQALIYFMDGRDAIVFKFKAPLQITFHLAYPRISDVTIT